MNRGARRAVVALLIGLAVAGCARGRGQGRRITPSTTGTDLQAMPRGEMNPLPFPGSSLARSGSSHVDPAAEVVSGPR